MNTEVTSGERGIGIRIAWFFGATLLIGSDLVARTVLPNDLPVGIVTAIIGGPFLVYLLVRANVKRAA